MVWCGVGCVREGVCVCVCVCVIFLYIRHVRSRSALLHVMRKKMGLRALDLERAAYKKLGWQDPPNEPVLSAWEEVSGGGGAW